jgi:hypothetical protein
LDLPESRTLLPTPVSFQVVVRLGEQEHVLRRFSWIRTGTRSSSRGSGDSLRLPKLDPEITTATVIFKPDRRWAEEHIGIDMIWGDEIVFENVPLERHDLVTTAAQ